VRASGAAAVAMHMRGTPADMAGRSEYRNVRAEVYEALASATARAESDGIPAERILIDPGLGFAKTGPQSLEILGHLGEFRSLGYAVVVGASRKSFLGAALGGGAVDERLEASVAAAVVAALHGAHVVRVHDVAPTVRALRVADALRADPLLPAPAGGEGWEGDDGS